MFNREAVLRKLFDKAKSVDENVFTSFRPTATEPMGSFIVVRLPQGISPYADTHHTAYGQMVCYVKDRQGGVENVPKLDEMIDGVTSLFPFNDELMSCNNPPELMFVKSDGMGFHSAVIQFKLVVKV